MFAVSAIIVPSEVVQNYGYYTCHIHALMKMSSFITSTPEQCDYKLPVRQAFCVPTAGFEERFLDLEGRQKTVTGVRECGCLSG